MIDQKPGFPSERFQSPHQAAVWFKILRELHFRPFVNTLYDGLGHAGWVDTPPGEGDALHPKQFQKFYTLFGLVFASVRATRDVPEDGDARHPAYFFISLLGMIASQKSLFSDSEKVALLRRITKRNAIRLYSNEVARSYWTFCRALDATGELALHLPAPGDAYNKGAHESLMRLGTRHGPASTDPRAGTIRLLIFPGLVERPKRQGDGTTLVKAQVMVNDERPRESPGGS